MPYYGDNSRSSFPPCSHLKLARLNHTRSGTDLNFESLYGIRLRVQRNESGRHIFPSAARELRAHDRTWIDRPRPADPRNMELVIVPVAHDVVSSGPGNRPRDVIKMVHGHLAAIEHRLDEFAMDPHTVRRFPGNPEQVGVVIAKNDVNRSRKPPELIHDERRTEISTADQRVGSGDMLDRAREIPEVIVDVGQNRDSHV
jgi:hypothetical protein